jgi:hypothetical protein
MTETVNDAQAEAIDAIVSPALEQEDAASQTFEEDGLEQEAKPLENYTEEASEGTSESEEDFDQEEEVEAEAEEAEEVEEEEEEESEGEPETLTVKVDGEHVEVTLDELKRSYSGQKYIQKGMQEAANIKKHAENLYNTLQAERAQFAQQLQSLQQQGVAQPPAKPNAELLENDPLGYMQAKAQYDQDLEVYNQQQAMIRSQFARQQQLDQMAQKEIISQETQKLVEMIPEFKDQEKAQQLRNDLINVGRDAYGFGEQELMQVTDSRMIKVLHDAYQWQQIQRKRDTSKKSPAKPKTLNKARPRKPDSSETARRKKFNQAKKSGKAEAFVDLILDN